MIYCPTKTWRRSSCICGHCRRCTIRLPKTEISFPLKYIMRNFPEPLTAPVPEPTFSSPEKRGEYLTHLIGCADCHTPVDAQQNFLPGMEFGGGQVFVGTVGQGGDVRI